MPQCRHRIENDRRLVVRLAGRSVDPTGQPCTVLIVEHRSLADHWSMIIRNAHSFPTIAPFDLIAFYGR